ncbi:MULTISPECIES: hypothetical protein [unclassified Haematobacter]|uniref:hypothetical protein n=1 Tax=unclassified Haematobacter TaxID=2640585 RepID=UPI0025BE6797|nr:MULTISPECIES: hypothetical protein [unclassified Haematobacter]
MNPTTTVRLAAAATILGRGKHFVRLTINEGNAPYEEDSFGGAKQRRFTTYHLLAEVCAEILCKQGFTVPEAGGFVRGQAGVLRGFIEALESSAEPQARFVIAAKVAVEDRNGVRAEEVHYGHTGSAGEIEALFGALLEATGRETNGKRQIGGPVIAVASVGEAHRLLCARAEAVGYVIRGNEIIAGETVEQADEEA